MNFIIFDNYLYYKEIDTRCLYVKFFLIFSKESLLSELMPMSILKVFNWDINQYVLTGREQTDVQAFQAERLSTFVPKT